MIVIYYTLGAYGGSHTLMVRMGVWLNSRNIKMTIIGTSVTNTEIIGKLKGCNVKVIEADLSDDKTGFRVVSSLLQVEQIKVYCFSWNHYLDIERLKKKYRWIFDNFVYCIHPETFKKGIGFKTRFMREYSINSYRSILERMNQNGSLISLDEVNLRESEKYLKCNLDKTTPIVYLPMYCPERDDKEEIITQGFDSNVILTAARADFPYKGYMVGLIDLFVDLKNKYPKAELEIVASGDDIQILKDKIANQTESIKASIKLHGWMDYEELKTQMRQCKVYIGMGTTVFDAALQYKPSIVVKFNTMKCYSDHFVSERPTYMTVISPDCSESAYNRIEDAFSWNFEEYRTQSLDSFSKTKEIYDIDICMDKLTHMETKNKGSLLSNKECFRHHLNQQINKIRFRNIHASDYMNIELDKAK